LPLSGLDRTSDGSPAIIPAARRARVLDLLKRDGTIAPQRLTDSSKFRVSAFCEICPIDLVHQVVCDDGLAASDREAMEKLGVQVSLVPSGPST
jgi:DeoR/GlpR family transcriptional regulator of sugar metabolism